MTNISVFYIDYHVVFYIHSSTIVCLKFLWNDRVWILCFCDLHFVIRGYKFISLRIKRKLVKIEGVKCSNTQTTFTLFYVKTTSFKV
ncbi:hypothetical protein Hanom_Chr12g01069041 [Helianthus anomalus]